MGGGGLQLEPARESRAPPAAHQNQPLRQPPGPKTPKAARAHTHTPPVTTQRPAPLPHPPCCSLPLRLRAPLTAEGLPTQPTSPPTARKTSDPSARAHGKQATPARTRHSFERVTLALPGPFGGRIRPGIFAIRRPPPRAVFSAASPCWTPRKGQRHAQRELVPRTEPRRTVMSRRRYNATPSCLK